VVLEQYFGFERIAYVHPTTLGENRLVENAAGQSQGPPRYQPVVQDHPAASGSTSLPGKTTRHKGTLAIQAAPRSTRRLPTGFYCAG
jgi:hypothetical protein